MAEDNADLETLMDRAKRHEKTYDWLAASRCYDEVLERGLASGDLEQGRCAENGAYARLKHAFQADDPGQFKERLDAAAAQYSKAKDIYGRVGGTVALPYLLRCDSALSYIGYWMMPRVDSMKAASDCWATAMQSLQAFGNDDAMEYGRTFNQFIQGAFVAISYSEYEKIMEILIPALEYGERAIKLLTGQSDPEALAAAYAKTSGLHETYSALCDWRDAARNDRRAKSYMRKASQISEEVALTDTSWFFLGLGQPYGVMPVLQRRLEHAVKTKDALALCYAYSCLASEWNWRQATVQDPEEFELNSEQALKNSIDAQKASARLSFMSPYCDSELWIEVPHTGVYGIRAYFEIEFQRAREFSEKAVQASGDLIRLAEASGYPDIMFFADHQSAYNLTTLARTEKDHDTRMRLLEQALGHRMTALRLYKRLQTRGGWGRGTMLNLLAETEFELAALADDTESKTKLLRDAADHRREGLDQNLKYMSVFKEQEPWEHRLLGRWFSEYGATQEALYAMEGRRELLTSAAETHDRAAKLCTDSSQLSRAAEALWKAATVYDSVEDFSKASDRFDSAADLYKRAAEAVPKLNDLYQDHSKYMQAWAEIERARNHHARQDATAAKEAYEKAVVLLESTERWTHLGLSFAAAAEFESGEDLSRRDMSEDAISEFKKASELFSRAGGAIKSAADRTEGTDEIERFSGMARKADLLRDYCLGRVLLEGARILDKKGDELGAYERYGQAAEVFEKTEAGLDSDQDRREIRLVTTLTRAWQKMAKAEAEASPELYKDASAMFQTARDLSVGERAKSLASGHCQFCKALEAAMKFADSGDASFQSMATQDMENASKHYLKAGLVKDSEYVKASKLLLDAYLYMDKAVKEDDPAKKARLYVMTEKVLEASSESFSMAGYPKKREQVARLSEKVKGERELAIALSEVLRAPDLVSSSATIMTTPLRERAAGLQRFEHARIELTVMAAPSEAKVGEEVHIDVDMVNAGAGTAQLARIDDVIPPGFDLVSRPGRCLVDECGIDLRGRRLDPLASETIPLVLRPLSKGSFSFSPRVMYLDESGEQKWAGPKHITLTVKELGVAGWLRGPSKMG